MTIATINPDDSLEEEWSNPVRISGEQGPQGEIGPVGPKGDTGTQGPSGIHGVSFVIQYCAGNETNYLAENDESKWSYSISDAKNSITEEYLYIWCRQGLKEYNDSEDSVGTIN